MVNVAAFHAALAPQGLGVVAVVLIAGIIVMRRYRAAFTGVFTARAGAGTRAVRIVEILFGVAFFASGIMGLVGRTPPPATMGAAMMMRGLEASGYFIPALCGVQMLAGAMLVLGRYVGLALLALAPVVVEIVAYRLYVAAATPGMMLAATALLAAQAWLCFAHRQTFATLTGGVGEA